MATKILLTDSWWALDGMVDAEAEIDIENDKITISARDMADAVESSEAAVLGPVDFHNLVARAAALGFVDLLQASRDAAAWAKGAGDADPT